MTEQQIQAALTSQQLSIMDLVHHRTLEKFTGGPTVERSRLFFLLLPFFNGEQWSGEIGTSAKTISIVHAALQAHDRIEENGSATKEQQLTVLAGDYYSGIYYQLLAKLENILLIRQLSSAIASISEDKASFYIDGDRSFDDIDASVRNIESGLVGSFYRFYGYDMYQTLAEHALTILRYEQELESLREGRFTKVLGALTDASTSRLKTEQWLQEKLSKLYDGVIRLIRQQPLKYELKNFLLHQILPQPYQMEQLTREG